MGKESRNLISNLLSNQRFQTVRFGLPAVWMLPLQEKRLATTGLRLRLRPKWVPAPTGRDRHQRKAAPLKHRRRDRIRSKDPEEEFPIKEKLSLLAAAAGLAILTDLKVPTTTTLSVSCFFSIQRLVSVFDDMFISGQGGWKATTRKKTPNWTTSLTTAPKKATTIQNTSKRSSITTVLGNLSISW